MSESLFSVVQILCLTLSTVGGLMQKPDSVVLPADLAYETFCKNDEPVRRKRFRAATPEQQSVLTRRQIDRWREVNRPRLSDAQLAVLQELWTMAAPAMFAPTDEGRQTMKSFERRASAAFSGRELDEISPFGPCVETR